MPLGLIRQVWTLLALGLLLLMVAVAGALAPTVIQRVITEAFIRLVMVVGLYVFVGNSGVLSFGHASFMLIGAYGSAWLSLPVRTKRIFLKELPPFLGNVELPPWLAALCAMGFSALVAGIVGVPLVRLSGLGAAIGTFSVLAIVFVVYSNWDDMTNGTSSLIGLAGYVDIWVAYGGAVGAMTAAFLFQNSRLGLALRASREDEVAAKAIGVNVPLARLAAFALSAALVALGGVLQAHFLTTLNVQQFYIGMTFLTIAMLVVGGMGSLAGAVAGTAVLSLVFELLRQLEVGFVIGETAVQLPPGLRELGVAIIMILILIFRPAGLMAGREVPLPAWLRPRPSEGSTA
jgi:branched-chain amino acid transport system permease protein